MLCVTRLCLMRPTRGLVKGTDGECQHVGVAVRDLTEDRRSRFTEQIADTLEVASPF